MKLKYRKKIPQKQGKILEGGEIFLAGQNIFPCNKVNENEMCHLTH